MKRHKAKFDPSLPLRNPQHESFARLRVVLVPALEAMQRAEPPYKKPTAGNAARLDRYDTIIARVRYLAAHDSDMEMLQLRRARIRSMLEKIALTDRTRLMEYVEEPVIAKGEAVLIDGEPLMRTVQRFRRFEELTEDERMLVEFGPQGMKTAERLAALAQLCKLDGLDRPTKVSMTDEDGHALAPVAPIINLTGRPEPVESTGANNG